MTLSLAEVLDLGFLAFGVKGPTPGMVGRGEEVAAAEVVWSVVSSFVMVRKQRRASSLPCSLLSLSSSSVILVKLLLEEASSVSRSSMHSVASLRNIKL